MLNKSQISGFADEIDQSLDVQIEVLHALGQDYIDFRGADGMVCSQYTLEQARTVKDRLDAAGIRVSCLGSPVGKIQIADDFELHFEMYKHVVEVAKVMGTKFIRMFSFRMPADEDPDTYEDEVFNRLEKMIEYAAEHDVVLLHENEKNIFGDNMERCLKLMERFYGDSFKFIFDFANFVQCKQDTWEAYENLKPYIAYLHIKDADWDTGKVVVPGTGDGQLERIFTAMDEAGYEGFLSLEPHLSDQPRLMSKDEDDRFTAMSDRAANYAVAHRALSTILNRTTR